MPGDGLTGIIGTKIIKRGRTTVNVKVILDQPGTVYYMCTPYSTKQVISGQIVAGDPEKILVDHIFGQQETRGRS